MRPLGHYLPDIHIVGLQAKITCNADHLHSNAGHVSMAYIFHTIGYYNMCWITCDCVKYHIYGALLRHINSYWWWRRHQMETFSASLAFCARNSPVTGEFSAQRPVTQSFDVFFDLSLNKRLSKQSRRWWFETPSRPPRRHYNVMRGQYANQGIRYIESSSGCFEERPKWWRHGNGKA